MVLLMFRAPEESISPGYARDAFLSIVRDKRLQRSKNSEPCGAIENTDDIMSFSFVIAREPGASVGMADFVDPLDKR